MLFLELLPVILESRRGRFIEPHLASRAEGQLKAVRPTFVHLLKRGRTSRTAVRQASQPVTSFRAGEACLRPLLLGERLFKPLIIPVRQTFLSVTVFPWRAAFQAAHHSGASRSRRSRSTPSTTDFSLSPYYVRQASPPVFKSWRVDFQSALILRI